MPAVGFSGNCARVLSSCVAHCVEFDVVVQYIHIPILWVDARERKAASQPRLRGKQAQWRLRSKLRGKRAQWRGKPVVEDAMHWHSCHAPHSHCFSGCYSKFEERPPSWITELLQKQFSWDGIVFSSKKRARSVEVFGTKDTQRLPRARYHLRHSTRSNSCKMWLVTNGWVLDNQKYVKQFMQTWSSKAPGKC